jgi:hypothetical protein
MKTVLLMLGLIVLGNSLFAQYTYTIKADSVRITNCDSSELILENHTQGIPGFLFNTGNGRTIFKRGAMKINDSLYLIGADTLNIPKISSNVWIQGGNVFGTTGILGTLDSNHLDIYTNKIPRGRITNTGDWLINASIDSGYNLQVNGTTHINGVLTTTLDAIINGVSIGRGAGNVVSNTAIGNLALRGNPANAFSTAVGGSAAQFSTGSVTAFGYAAAANSTGNSMLAIGYRAGQYVGGGYSIAIGDYALGNAAETNWGNIVLGHISGRGITTGGFNTLIGHNNANGLTTGSNNTILGYNTATGLSTGSNNTIVGAQITGLPAGLSNNIILADGSGNQRLNIDAIGDFGINAMNPSSTFQINQSTTGPGSVSNSTNGTTVTGIGTLFTSMFETGDSITVGGQTVAITAIASDLSLTTATPITAIHISVPYYLSNINRLTMNDHGNTGFGGIAPTSRVDISGRFGYTQFRLRQSYTPSSSTDTNGNVGDFAWDVNYLYIKTSAGWKRTTLSSF